MAVTGADRTSGAGQAGVFSPVTCQAADTSFQAQAGGLGPRGGARGGGATSDFLVQGRGEGHREALYHERGAETEEEAETHGGGSGATPTPLPPPQNICSTLSLGGCLCSEGKNLDGL